MTTRPRPKVGDVLWLAYTEPRDAGREHTIVVTKVGRRWATAYRADEPPEKRRKHLEVRFDLTDPRWIVDLEGFSFDARVWSSRSAWQDELLRDQAMEALRRAIEHVWPPWTVPVPVTLADVLGAARLLGVADRIPQLVHAMRAEEAGRKT